MIARHCFSKEWIAEQRKRFPKADPYLIERQLAAFELLGLLAQSEKQFVFKGGTALILLLPVARRLSIDLDIVGDFSIEELVAVAKGSLFSRMEEDEREKKGIPKRHFKFYYTSVVDGREAYVLLDILYAEHGFPKLLSVLIVNELFETEKDVRVTTPTINGITGDKLTAFAPRTIGVPYGAGKSMEIIKQLFDMGELFDHCSSVSEVSAAYSGIWKQEVSYRNKRFTLSQTLNDTIEAAFLVSQARFKGSIDNDKLKEMQMGIGQLTNYFLGIKYTLEDARLSASKVALLAKLLRTGQTAVAIEDLKFDQSKIDEIRDVAFQGKLQILNKLKGVNPKAFYYWWLLSKL
jgi:hypothetical protein